MDRTVKRRALYGLRRFVIATLLVLLLAAILFVVFDYRGWSPSLLLEQPKITN